MAHSHEQHAVFVFARCSIHFQGCTLAKSKQKEMSHARTCTAYHSAMTQKQANQKTGKQKTSIVHFRTTENRLGGEDGRRGGHAGGLLTLMIAVQHNGRDNELGMMTAAADIAAVSPHNQQGAVLAIVPREGQA